MGQDKALVELAGQPMVAHALLKLEGLCEQVALLTANPELRRFRELVPDVHPGCGPLGGMEAALRHTSCDWNLFLPVDVPFVPRVLLRRWITEVLPDAAAHGARALMFTVEERPQPTLSLLHRDLRPWLTEALEAGQYKLLPALARGAGQLAAQAGFARESGLWMRTPSKAFAPSSEELEGKPARRLAGDGQAGHEPWHRWFANLNTPEELAEAERHIEELDRLGHRSSL